MWQSSREGVAALRRVSLFADAPAPAMERMAACAAWLQAEPGRLVLDYEDRTTDVVFVMAGSIRVSVQTAGGGHVRLLGDFHAGEFVGELSAIDGAPRSARVETLVRSSLCLVPAEAFLAITAEVPAVGLRIMRLLSARIRAQTLKLLEQTALPIRLRVGAELLRIARPRADGTLVISPPPTQEDLANRIGARRETVSRELGILTRAGLLQRTRASIVLRDPGALEAAVRHGLDSGVFLS